METQTNNTLQESLIKRYAPPVQKVPKDNGKFAIIDHVGREVSEVSARYTLIQNSDILAPLIQHFGADSLKTAYSFQGNRNLYLAFDTAREFDIGGGDIIKERFIAINSYDKTRSVRFMLGAFRLVCQNGLFAQFNGVDFRHIHTGNIPIAQIIQGALTNLSANNYDNWRKLRSVDLTLDQQTELVNDFQAIDVKDETKRWSDGVMNNRAIIHATKYYLAKPESVDNQRNAWGLYNQINRAVKSTFGTAAQTTQRLNVNLKAEEYLLKTLNLN